MNAMEERFLQVKRLSVEQLTELHEVEDRAAARWDAHRDEPAKRGDGWKIAGVRFLNDVNRRLPAFWSSRVPEQDRARAIDIFLHDPAVCLAFKMTGDASKTEVQALHAADVQVLRNAPAVGAGAGADIRERLKDAYGA